MLVDKNCLKTVEIAKLLALYNNFSKIFPYENWSRFVERPSAGARVGLFVPFVPNGTKFDESRLSRNLNGRFSLNFPDSNMAMRRIICASLGEFLCSKLEISLKTQENIFRSEQNLTKVDYLKI